MMGADVLLTAAKTRWRSSSEARQHLHYKLVTTDHLDDALSGLRFLETAPGIDPKRIAIVGHSFGGVITLLSGDRDAAVRAEVTFGAGASCARQTERSYPNSDLRACPATRKLL